LHQFHVIEALNAKKTINLFFFLQFQNILKDLNKRTLEQLTNTKYIGKNKAEALVKYRQEHGPLRDLAQLRHIKGYGKAFFTWLEQNGEIPPTTKKFSRQHEILSLLISDEQKKASRVKLIRCTLLAFVCYQFTR